MKQLEQPAFDDWLRVQLGERCASATADKIQRWRPEHDASAAGPLHSDGLTLKPMRPREERYAVVVDDRGLWLTLWVRFSPKGEMFVIYPRPHAPSWAPHASLHRDGAFHHKAHGKVLGAEDALQCPDSIRGVLRLGTFAGHDPRRVAVPYEPGAFTEALMVGANVLLPTGGAVTIELAEPGHAETASIGPEHGHMPAARAVFRRTAGPSVVIAAWAPPQLSRL